MQHDLSMRAAYSPFGDEGAGERRIWHSVIGDGRMDLYDQARGVCDV